MMHSVSIFHERNQLANSLLSFHQMLLNFTVQWTSLWLRSKHFFNIMFMVARTELHEIQRVEKMDSIQKSSQNKYRLPGYLKKEKFQVQRNAVVLQSIHKSVECPNKNQSMQSNCTRKPVVKTITCDSLHCSLFRTKQRKSKFDLSFG